MLLTIIILIISIQIIKRNNYFNLFTMGYLLGILFTESDYLFKLLDYFLYKFSYPITNLYNAFSHSIITISLVFIILLIVSEYKKSYTTKIIANGMMFGYITHVVIDIIFSFISITIFWPLPVEPIRLYEIKFINLYYFISSIITLGLIRYFLWTLNESILLSRHNTFSIVKTIFKWMKNQIYFLILIVTFYLIKFDYYMMIYDLITTINLCIIIYILYSSILLFRREIKHG